MKKVGTGSAPYFFLAMSLLTSQRLEKLYAECEGLHAVYHVLDAVILELIPAKEMVIPFATLDHKLVEQHFRDPGDPSIGSNDVLVRAVIAQYARLGDMRKANDGFVFVPKLTGTPRILPADHKEEIKEKQAQPGPVLRCRRCTNPAIHFAGSAFCEDHRCKSCEEGAVRIKGVNMETCARCSQNMPKAKARRVKRAVPVPPAPLVPAAAIVVAQVPAPAPAPVPVPVPAVLMAALADAPHPATLSIPTDDEDTEDRPPLCMYTTYWRQQAFQNCVNKGIHYSRVTVGPGAVRFCEAHRCKECKDGGIRMMRRASERCKACYENTLSAKRAREEAEDEIKERRPARRARLEESS
jgi:hypothetical protein